jgi:uncharacterized protein (TIGR03083 family)
MPVPDLTAVQTADVARTADATDAIMGLWDRFVALAEHIEPHDWSRATPCPDLDVSSLVAHVAAGTPPLAGTERTGELWRDQLLAARRGQAARLAALTAHATAAAPSERTRDRLLGASCLDMWVHAYDLATALGQPVDLDEDSPAVQHACRYLLCLTPHLFARGAGDQEGATLRIALRGEVDHDAALAVREGQGLWGAPGDAAGHEVTATPAAFLLLLSGRGEASRSRDRGALTWTGARGEAFVRGARLPG